MRRTPYITQQTQGYSAIVNELHFTDGNGNDSYWIPEEDAKNHVTYTPQIMAKQNNVTVTPDADAAKSAKVEVVTGPDRVMYKFKVIKNGHYYVPDTFGKESIRKIVVDVQHEDVKEHGEAYKNGTYEPENDFGFSSFYVEARKETSYQPQPGEVYPSLYIDDNGYFYPPEGYTGVEKAEVRVIKDKKLSGWTDVTTSSFPQLDSCAAVAEENAINIFYNDRWYRIVGSVIATSALTFNTNGMAAFIAGGKIHLVGSSDTNAAPVHKIKNDDATNPWIDGSIENLPNGLFYPNIVNADGEIYIVGASVMGGNPLASQKAYHYNAEDDEWEVAFELPEPVYNYMDAVYMDGGIHIWSGDPSYVHIICTYREDLSGWFFAYEDDYPEIFRSTQYKLLPVYGSPKKVIMINANKSFVNNTCTIASCEKTEDGYVYKFEGFVPYNRYGESNKGFGQNALYQGDTMHIFGGNGGRRSIHFTANWAIYIE